MKTDDRIVFIDYVRVIACFLVMLVHSSEPFYINSALTSEVATEANRFWVTFYDGFFGRISVPLFMIVSAFLLAPMKPGQTMRGFYARRFKRILPPMIFFLILYAVLPPLWGQGTWEQAKTDLMLLPFKFPDYCGHMWFMYPLISLYLIIPVVSPWLEKVSARDERLFLYFFAASTFVPWLIRFVHTDLWGWCLWNPFFGMLYYCSGYLGYLVLAHYIRTHIKWSASRRMKVGALCMLLGGAFTAWSFWTMGKPGVEIDSTMIEWSWEFCTPNVVLATFGAFLMFTCISRIKAPRLITDIARCSFGMYLMHMFFLSNIAAAMVCGDPANPILPVWLAIPTIAILSFVCCYVTTKLISLIPGSKWIIG